MYTELSFVHTCIEEVYPLVRENVRPRIIIDVAPDSVRYLRLQDNRNKRLRLDLEESVNNDPATPMMPQEFYHPDTKT